MIVARRYGQYKLEARYKKTAPHYSTPDAKPEIYATVTMYDYDSDLPLVWARTMTPLQAKAALDMFEQTGGF